MLIVALKKKIFVRARKYDARFSRLRLGLRLDTQGARDFRQRGRQSAPARMGTARSSARRRLDSARLSRRRPRTPFSAQGRIHSKNLKSKKELQGRFLFHFPI